MTTIEFVVWGSPIAQPRQRHTPLMRGGAPVIGRGERPVVVNYTPKTAPVNQWKSDCKWAAVRARNEYGLTGNHEVWEGPIKLTVTFFLPRPQSRLRKKDPDGPIAHTVTPDLENLIKSLQDSLTGVIYHDDKQICWVNAGKYFHERDKGPRAEVKLMRLE